MREVPGERVVVVDQDDERPGGVRRHGGRGRWWPIRFRPGDAAGPSVGRLRLVGFGRPVCGVAGLGVRSDWGGRVAGVGGATGVGGAARGRAVAGGRPGSGGRAARAAARVAVTGPEGQVAGQPSMAVTGRTPATALVTKTSLALGELVEGQRLLADLDPVAARRAHDRRPGGAGQQAAVGGRGQQHAVDDREHVRPVGLQELAGLVGDQQLLIGGRPAAAASSASSRRSRHLCPPMPPATVTGRRVIASAVEAGLVGIGRAPAALLAVISGRGGGGDGAGEAEGDDLDRRLEGAADRADGDAEAAGRCERQAGGQVGVEAGGEVLAVEVADAGRQAGEVIGQASGLAVGDEQRAENAGRGTRREPASATWLADSAPP